MMTKLINLYYKALMNLGVWCFKLVLACTESWREKFDVIQDIEDMEDKLLTQHWTIARETRDKLYNLKVDTMNKLEKDFKEMESIYYGDEETA